jgi:hypothetical protein
MTDEEAAASVVTYWQASDHWPWECLKFAERSGLEMSYFLPAVEGALRLRDWPDRMIEVPTGLPERIFRLLRERARRERGLAAPAALPADRDETEYPNPNFKNIKGESKRAGDIRKFDAKEINRAAEQIIERYPALYKVIVRGVAHKVMISGAQMENLVDFYSWTFYPLKHALFHIYPEIDSLDISELAQKVFGALEEHARP